VWVLEATASSPSVSIKTRHRSQSAETLMNVDLATSQTLSIRYNLHPRLTQGSLHTSDASMQASSSHCTVHHVSERVTVFRQTATPRGYYNHTSQRSSRGFLNIIAAVLYVERFSTHTNAQEPSRQGCRGGGISIPTPTAALHLRDLCCCKRTAHGGATLLSKLD